MEQKEIFDMKPGRELDVLVAQEIMGCEVELVDVLVGYSYDPEKEVWGRPSIVKVPCVKQHGVVSYIDHRPEAICVLDAVKHYSTDAVDALDVVERLSDLGFTIMLQIDGDGTLDRFTHQVVVIDKEHPESSSTSYGDSKSFYALAEAICKAGLMAVRKREGR